MESQIYLMNEIVNDNVNQLAKGFQTQWTFLAAGKGLGYNHVRFDGFWVSFG